MIFRFVVRHCRWLGRVPLLPQLFDALLLMGTALTNRGRLRAIELLEERAVELFHATLAVHRFGGVGFVAGGRELGHVHGNGLFDAFVGRANRDRVVAAGMALPHHVFPRSGWVSFWIERESDVERTVELLRMSEEADSRHADGTSTYPFPPTSPFTSATLSIYSAAPGSPGATVLFTSNTLSMAAWTGIYRVSTPLTNANRPVMSLTMSFANVALAAGNYYAAWTVTGAVAPGNPASIFCSLSP